MCDASQELQIFGFDGSGLQQTSAIKLRLGPGAIATAQP
jgi:hypothetical protein